MPTYEYQCEKCGVFEVSQRMSDEKLTACPTCGSPVQRLLSAAPFHLKGSGWYKTDYAKNGSSNSLNTATASKGSDSSKKSTTDSEVSSTSSSSSGETKSAPAATSTSTKTESSTS